MKVIQSLNFINFLLVITIILLDLNVAIISLIRNINHQGQEYIQPNLLYYPIFIIASLFSCQLTNFFPYVYFDDISRYKKPFRWQKN